MSEILSRLRTLYEYVEGEVVLRIALNFGRS
jgi:hypothetical protein